MKSETFIRVIDFVDGSICVSTEHAQKLYDKIVPMIREGHKIALSFEQVKTLFPVFFNAAVGRLYEEFTEEEISQNISFQNLPVGWDNLHRYYMDRAKEYYENPEA